MTQRKILREAELADFETFRVLYENDDKKEVDYQWLYYDKTKSNIPDEEAKEIIKHEFGDLSEFEEFFKNYTIQRFEKDLKILHIYMIEKDSEILGYVSMFYCNNGNYKIAEWAMFNPDDIEIKKEILEAMAKLKLPRLRKFSICTLSKSTADFLMSNGFEPSGAKCFYTWKIK